MKSLEQKKLLSNLVKIGLFLMILVGLNEASLYSYLLFHYIVEIFIIFVAFSIFVISYHSRGFSESSFFPYLGMCLLFVGIIQLLHTLAYQGTGIFPTYTGSNLATSLWILARYVESVVFVIAIVFVKRKVNLFRVFCVNLVFIILFLALIFSHLFPVCYVDGIGLTPFKIISEYVIVGIRILTIFLFYRIRTNISKNLLRLIIISLIFSIMAELSFTLYVDVYGLLNKMGHIFILLAYYAIYNGLIQKQLRDPYEGLFYTLKKNEAALKNERNALFISNHQIEVLVNTIPNGLVFFDSLGNLVRKNPAFDKLYFLIYNEPVPLKSKIFNIIDSANFPNNAVFKKIREIFQEKSEVNEIIDVENGRSIQITSSFVMMSVQGKSVNLAENSNNQEERTNYKEKGAGVGENKTNNNKWGMSNQEGGLNSIDSDKKGLLIIFHDVTDFVQLDRIRRSLVSTVSHELRTPITSIDLSAKNLEKYWEKLDEKQKEELLKLISNNSAVLVHIVEDLLTSSRLESSRLKLDWEKYNLNEVIQNVAQLMQQQLKEKEISLSIDAPLKLELFGDFQRIGQIIRIFIENAIKYGKQNGFIKLKVIDNYLGRFNSNNMKGCLISIQDSGIGIPPNDIPNLYNRFFRSQTVQHIQGTGLGLSIAKELIGFHKGEVFVESKLGEGTTFSIFLPYCEKKPDIPTQNPIN